MKFKRELKKRIKMLKILKLRDNNLKILNKAISNKNISDYNKQNIYKLSNAIDDCLNKEYVKLKNT